MILVLVNKIATLALIMFMGWLLGKLRVLNDEASNAISKLLLYLVIPCVTINSFQVDYTPDVRNGLLLAFFAAAATCIFLLTVGHILKRLLHLNPVEQLSVTYPNVGNLVIPLVAAILGADWVIYTSAFIVVQTILFWSHGKAVLCGDRKFEFKKVFGSINMICVFVGMGLFFTGIRLPALLQDVTDSVGNMIGPLSMLVSGMLISGLKLRQVISYKRVWLIVFLRLIVLSLCAVLLIKYSGITRLIPNGKDVLLVTVLGAAAPSATSIINLAQVHNKDAQYACAINVITTVLCILTIPVMVALYQL